MERIGIGIYPTSITISYIEQYKAIIRNNNKCNYIWTKYNIIDILFYPLNIIHQHV